MNNFIYLFTLATIPIAILLMYVYSKDRYDKEPKLLIAKLFFLGALTVIPVIIFELIAGLVFHVEFGSSEHIPHISSGNFLSLFLYSLIGIGLVEEGFKFIALRFGVWDNIHFDRRFDAIVYSVSVSLGFASIENIGYLFSYGDSIAVSRALYAVPAHACLAIIMGYYFGKAKFGKPEERFFLLFKGLTIPVILHGIYDFLLFCSATQPAVSTIWFIFFVIFIVKALRILSEQAREDRAATIIKYESQLIHAGFFRRIGALIVDFMIIQIALAIIVSCIQSELGIGESPTESEFALIGIIAILGELFLSWVYYVTMESSHLKATLGKLAFGIIVTDKNFDQISFLTANGRHFGRFICLLTVFTGYLLIFFTKKHQTLHDIISGTLVERKMWIKQSEFENYYSVEF